MKRVQNISDWKLNRTQKEYPSEGLTHALWETPDEMFALYFYKIGEYGVTRTCSRLQILRDKSNPQMVYDSQEEIFDCNIYDWSFLENNYEDKGFLLLRLLRFNPFREPLVLIKVENLQYVSWDKFHVKFLFNNNNSVTLIETFFDKEGNSQKIETENYKLNEIKWRHLHTGERIKWA